MVGVGAWPAPFVRGALVLVAPDVFGGLLVGLPDVVGVGVGVTAMCLLRSTGAAGDIVAAGEQVVLGEGTDDVDGGLLICTFHNVYAFRR